jgi:hypothetical protein
LILIIAAVVLSCVCGIGTLIFLQQAPDLQEIPLWKVGSEKETPAATATSVVVRPTATWTMPATATATPTPLPDPTATPTTAPTWTPAATATAMPTATVAPTATPTPTQEMGTPAPPVVGPSPTPFVCRDIYHMATVELAPGQTFSCSVSEEELTQLADDYPESPCNETAVQLDDGEIKVTCDLGIRMWATLRPVAEKCRVRLHVLGGTLGFRQIVEELIATQFHVIRYDSICVDSVVVDAGRITVTGHGIE